MFPRSNNNETTNSGYILSKNCIANSLQQDKFKINDKNKLSITLNTSKLNESDINDKNNKIVTSSKNIKTISSTKKCNFKNLKIDIFLCKKRNITDVLSNNSEVRDNIKSKNKVEPKRLDNSNNYRNIKDSFNNLFFLNEENNERIRNPSSNMKLKSKEELIEKIKEQEIIINSNNNELSSLKLALKEKENTIIDLTNENILLNNEVVKYRSDITHLLKELTAFKINVKGKYLHSKEFNVGVTPFCYSYDCLKNKNNIINERNDISFLKDKLESIQLEINNLTKTDKIDLTNKYSLIKIYPLLKEKMILKNDLAQLKKEKFFINYQRNLLNFEEICTFSLYKKDGLPLLSQRYQILELIGKGGYSEVYKAFDIIEHKYVVCKLVKFDNNWQKDVKENYIKHTVRENLILKGLNHENIVKLLDTIEINNNSFGNILEYVSGLNLALYIKKNGPLNEQFAKIIIYQILKVLVYLNKLPKKVIHYDLKPENIIFANDMSIKILDFGLAKEFSLNSDYLELTSIGLGTYWYLPPECFSDNKNINISSKVDIWSTGIILYEMLFNRKPFGNDYTSQKSLFKDKIIQNAYKVEFPENCNISDDCKDFIRNCLKYNEKERYDVFQAVESKFIKNNDIFYDSEILDLINNYNKNLE